MISEKASDEVIVKSSYLKIKRINYHFIGNYYHFLKRILRKRAAFRSVALRQVQIVFRFDKGVWHLH